MRIRMKNNLLYFIIYGFLECNIGSDAHYPHVGVGRSVQSVLRVENPVLGQCEQIGSREVDAGFFSRDEEAPAGWLFTGTGS